MNLLEQEIEPSHRLSADVQTRAMLYVHGLLTSMRSMIQRLVLAGVLTMPVLGSSEAQQLDPLPAPAKAAAKTVAPPGLPGAKIPIPVDTPAAPKDGETFGPPPDLGKLLTDLQSANFRTRAGAAESLEKTARLQIRMSGRPLAWKDRLLPPAGSSLENIRRVQELLKRCDREENALLWRPSRFAMPPEWKNGGKQVSLADVLTQLAKGTGTDLEYGIDRKILDELPASADIGGKTFWETFEALQRATGEKIALEYRPNGAMRVIPPVKNGAYRLLQDGICANLNQTDWGERVWLDLQIQAEPGILLDPWEVVSAKAHVPGGKQLEPTFLSHEYPGTPKKAYFLLQLLRADLPESGLVDLEFTVRLQAAPRKRVHVTDMTRRTELTRSQAPIAFTGVAVSDLEYAKRTGITHSVMVEIGPESLERTEGVFEAASCKALDRDGRLIPMIDSGIRSWGINSGAIYCWSFPREPHALEFVAPDEQRSTEATHTFRFGNVKIAPGGK